MGQYIHVDLNALSDAAAKVSTYRSERTSLLTQITAELRSANAAWRAEDYNAMIASWNVLRETDGALTQVDQRLEQYQNMLDAAYSVYKKAQQESAEQAESITSWTFC